MGRPGHCREHILEAGIKVLSAKGYNGTGVKEIVDLAGVPKGSFYNHFESKQAFVIEAIEKLAGESILSSKAILEAEGFSPKQRLLNFFDTGHQHMKEDSFNGGCLVGNICLEMADENPDIRESANAIMERYIVLIANCLQAAQEEGELSKELNTSQLAEFIHCAWEGAMMRMKGCRDCSPYMAFRSQVENFFIPTAA